MGKSLESEHFKVMEDVWLLPDDLEELWKQGWELISCMDGGWAGGFTYYFKKR